MRKKVMLLFSITFFLLVGARGWAEELPNFSITGTVKQPLRLTLSNLEQMQTIAVRPHEVMGADHSHGNIIYRGVPLKNVLDLAVVDKEVGANFPKPIDLAVVVKNAEGRQAVFSWGEIFDRNPGEIVIAYSSGPIRAQGEKPGSASGAAHHEQFPLLLVTTDVQTDRMIEAVTRIEVRPLVAISKAFTRGKTASSSAVLTITGAFKKPFILTKLFGYPRIEVAAKERNEETNQLKTYSGVSLRALLERAEITLDSTKALLVSAADGYRSLISFGEICLNHQGDRIIIADTVDGRPIVNQGNFYLVLPDDISMGRWVKAVSQLEVVTVVSAAKLYIIGMGCGDSNLITVEAITALGKADCYVGPDDILKRFAWYVGEKPILFDQRLCIKGRFDRDHANLSPNEREQLMQTEQDKQGAKVKDALNKGRSIALLDYGDPSLYGTWRWLRKYIPDNQIELIPGISSFNAANALMKKNLNCAAQGMGSIIITTPKDLKMSEDLVKTAADHGEILAIFMGLQDLKELTPLFQKYYADTTPVGLAYYVGVSEREKVIWTNLGQAAAVVEQEGEKFMGLIYLGQCLSE